MTAGAGQSHRECSRQEWTEKTSRRVESLGPVFSTELVIKAPVGQDLWKFQCDCLKFGIGKDWRGGLVIQLILTRDSLAPEVPWGASNALPSSPLPSSSVPSFPPLPPLSTHSFFLCFTSMEKKKNKIHQNRKHKPQLDSYTKDMPACGLAVSQPSASSKT